MENNLRSLDDMMANWQIKINWGKTKEMVVKRGGGSCNVSVKGGRIEEVKVMNFYNHNIYIYIYIHVIIPQGCFSL